MVEELDIPQWSMDFRIFLARTGLNVKKVSEITGLSYSTVNNFTLGTKRPGIKSCDKIKNGIGFDMLKALYLSDKKEREK